MCGGGEGCRVRGEVCVAGLFMGGRVRDEGLWVRAGGIGRGTKDEG